MTLGWWAGVKSGCYLRPVMLSPVVTVGRARDIQDLIDGVSGAGK